VKSNINLFYLLDSQAIEAIFKLVLLLLQMLTCILE
jgi:hypothetical protein